MESFAELQTRLSEVLTLNSPECPTEHVVVELPSFSVGESLLSHYANRIPSLEHRYLNALFMLDRIERCELVFVSCKAAEPQVIEYYLSLIPRPRRESVRRRFRVFEVPDASPRAVAAKLLDRPDLLDDLKRSFGGRPVFIEPWNVTDTEVRVARHLDAPINGTAPELWPIGFKSEGRRLFREAGVPIAPGVEDVHDVDEVLAAIATIRSERPTATGVVLKLDDSGAGDGNVVLDLRRPGNLRDKLEALPSWFVDDLANGGIVEEMISGHRFSSPSAQIDVLPDGSVRVLATHEQLLGGNDNQVYMGCQFPADPAYAAKLAEHADAAGRELGRRGVIGRASVDFAVAQDGSGSWRLFALEINLRKGGTTHPYAALRNLVPGRYDTASGSWIATDGTERAYRSTDNLVDPKWTDLPAASVIDAVAGAGLQFDSARGIGVILHMLSGLAIDGRVGLTAIGADPAEADRLYERAGDAISHAQRP